MPSQHKHQPIPFRPAVRNRAWLLEEAKETKRAVNAILNEALASHRKALQERRNQERQAAMASKVQDPEPLRAKWVMDGATTLTEAAAMLRAEADRIEQLGKDGWTLEGPIDDDWGFLVPPRGHNS
jgi:hypothetical protein